MTEKYGTKEIQRILDVLIKIGNTAPAVALAKGWLRKLIAATPVIISLFVLIKLDYRQLRYEWKDLSEDEKAELMAYAKTKYDIADDALEAAIEKGMELVKAVAEVTDRVIKYVRELIK